MTSNGTVPPEFLAYIRKIASDLRSSHATLAMLAKADPSISSVPGLEYILLNNAAIGIARIADDLFAKCKFDRSSPCAYISIPYVLLSLSTFEVVDKKRAEHKHVKFNCPGLSVGGTSFAFTKIDPKDLDFLLSSVIDQCVKALDGKGELDINVGSDGYNNAWIKISSNIRLALDAETSGSAIEIAQEYAVRISIEKTCVQLSFNAIDCPDWIAKNVIIHKEDTVVVLSDDIVINNELNSYFKKENILVEHFTSKEKAVAFINSFSQKERLFFLADLDLINKDLNGLRILWQTMIPRQTVFIIGSYSNQSILDYAHKAGVRVILKQLMSKIPCKILESERENVVYIKADIVIIDDDKPLADTLAKYLKNKHPTAKKYYNPYDFLKDIRCYNKNIKIIIDNSLGTGITGLEISAQLNAAGYTSIYLITGRDFAKGEIPDYITLIPKGDISVLNKVL